MAQYPTDPRYSLGGYGGGGLFGMPQQRMRGYGGMGGFFPQQQRAPSSGGFFPPQGGWNQPQAPSEKDAMGGQPLGMSQGPGTYAPSTGWNGRNFPGPQDMMQKAATSYMSAPGMDTQIPPGSNAPPQPPMAQSGLFKAPTAGLGNGMSLNDYVASLRNGGQLSDPSRDAAGMQNNYMPQQQPMGKGIVLAEGQQQQPGMDVNTAGGVTPFADVKTPTYLQGITANLYGGAPNLPSDPRMVWGMGGAGGTKGWQLVNGWNGYKG
jgi:hypothetical protein